MDHNVSFPDAEKIKGHFRKNKDRYLFFGLGAVVVLAIRKPITIAPVFNNNNLPVFANVVNNGGHMRKIVRCLETDEMWPSVSKAADAVGVTIPAMSRHINGHEDHVRGLHYVIDGLAAG